MSVFNVDVKLIKKEAMCRVCLGLEADILIFGEDRLAEKIQMCCPVEISENDGLPEQICSKCSSLLDTAVNFHKQCLLSDRLLRAQAEIHTEATPADEGDAHTSESLPIVHIKKEEDYSDWDDYEDLQPLKVLSKSVEIETVGEENTARKKQAHKIKKKVIGDNLNLEQKPCKKRMTKKDSNLQNGCKKKRKKELTLAGSNLCPICGKFYMKLSSLTAHLRQHTGERPFSCITCGKSFREKGRLTEHVRTHSAKESPCEVCGKMFRSVQDAKRHLDVVHKRIRVVQCKMCGKKLVTNSGYKLHMKMHTGEKPHACTFCSQTFTYKYALTTHLRTHTGEKPYACNFCGGKFSVLKTLREHERIHTGETPYSCPSCNKRFSQLSNMKSHFKNNHRGEKFNYVRKNSRDALEDSGGLEEQP